MNNNQPSVNARGGENQRLGLLIEQNRKLREELKLLENIDHCAQQLSQSTASAEQGQQVNQLQPPDFNYIDPRSKDFHHQSPYSTVNQTTIEPQTHIRISRIKSIIQTNERVKTNWVQHDTTEVYNLNQVATQHWHNPSSTSHQHPQLYNGQAQQTEEDYHQNTNQSVRHDIMLQKTQCNQPGSSQQWCRPNQAEQSEQVFNHEQLSVPSIPSQQHPNFSQQLSFPIQESSADIQQHPVHSQQQPTPRQQLSFTSQQHTIHTQKHLVPTQQHVSSQQHSASTHQLHVPIQQTPDHSQQQPSPHQQLSFASQLHSAYTQQPVSSQQPSNATHQPPVLTQQHPVRSQQQPTLRQQLSFTSQQHISSQQHSTPIHQHPVPSQQHSHSQQCLVPHQQRPIPIQQHPLPNQQHRIFTQQDPISNQQHTTNAAPQHTFPNQQRSWQNNMLTKFNQPNANRRLNYSSSQINQSYSSQPQPQSSLSFPHQKLNPPSCKAQDNHTYGQLYSQSPHVSQRHSNQQNSLHAQINRPNQDRQVQPSTSSKANQIMPLAQSQLPSHFYHEKSKSHTSQLTHPFPCAHKKLENREQTNNADQNWHNKVINQDSQRGTAPHRTSPNTHQKQMRNEEFVNKQNCKDPPCLIPESIQQLNSMQPTQKSGDQDFPGSLGNLIPPSTPPTPQNKSQVMTKQSPPLVCLSDEYTQNCGSKSTLIVPESFTADDSQPVTEGRRDVASKESAVDSLHKDNIVVRHASSSKSNHPFKKPINCVSFFDLTCPSPMPPSSHMLREGDATDSLSLGNFIDEISDTDVQKNPQKQTRQDALKKKRHSKSTTFSSSTKTTHMARSTTQGKTVKLQNSHANPVTAHPPFGHNASSDSRCSRLSDNGKEANSIVARGKTIKCYVCDTEIANENVTSHLLFGPLKCLHCSKQKRFCSYSGRNNECKMNPSGDHNFLIWVNSFLEFLLAKISRDVAVERSLKKSDRRLTMLEAEIEKLQEFLHSIEDLRLQSPWKSAFLKCDEYIANNKSDATDAKNAQVSQVHLESEGARNQVEHVPKKQQEDFIQVKYKALEQENSSLGKHKVVNEPEKHAPDKQQIDLRQGKDRPSNPVLGENVALDQPVEHLFMEHKPDSLQVKTKATGQTNTSPVKPDLLPVKAKAMEQTSVSPVNPDLQPIKSTTQEQANASPVNPGLLLVKAKAIEHTNASPVNPDLFPVKAKVMEQTDASPVKHVPLSPQTNRIAKTNHVIYTPDEHYVVVYISPENSPGTACPDCGRFICPLYCRVNVKTFVSTYSCPDCSLAIYFVPDICKDFITFRNKEVSKNSIKVKSKKRRKLFHDFFK